MNRRHLPRTLGPQVGLAIVCVLASFGSASAQFAWSLAEFEKAVSEYGGKATPDTDFFYKRLQHPMKAESHYFELKKKDASNPLDMIRAVVSLRGEKIARVMFYYPGSGEGVAKVLADLEDLRLLGPAAKGKPVYREDPFMRRIYPAYSQGTITIPREITAYTGYGLYEAGTNRRIQGIYAGTGKFVFDRQGFWKQMQVFAREDHEEYIAVGSVVEVLSIGGGMQAPTTKVFEVSFCDRESFWEFAFWDMREAVSIYEQGVKRQTQPKAYIKLQRDRRMEMFAYQIDYEPNPAEAIMRQIETESKFFPDTKSDLLSALRMGLKSTDEKLIARRVDALQAIYELESIHSIIDTFNRGKKLKESGAAALARLAARLALPEAPGPEASIKDWRDWAAAAKKAAK